MTRLWKGDAETALIEIEKNTAAIGNDFSEFPLVQVDRKIISRAMKRHQGKAFL